MRTNVKWIVALASIVVLAWTGWSTRPEQAPLDVLWDSPKDRARKLLKGWPKVEKLELTNVSLKEAVAELNRRFENTPGHGSIVFRAWQEGDPIPKEMHRNKSVAVPDAATLMPASAIEPITMDNIAPDLFATLVAHLYNCDLAVADDVIVLFPKGSFVCQLVERQYYLMWQVKDPAQDFRGATEIAKGKWDLQAWASENGISLCDDGYAHYEKMGNKVIVRAPRDEIIWVDASLSGSCAPHYAESAIDRIYLKAYRQWWSFRQKFFSPPAIPAMPVAPFAPASAPSAAGIPGLDSIPALADPQ